MSASVNKVFLIGNVTKDIELKKLQSDASVCSFGLATNRSWKNKNGEKQEEVEFHNIVAWGRLAEVLSQYAKKGSKINIIGRLRTRQWEDKDGNKRRQTEIVAEEMSLLDRKSATTGPSTENNADMGGIETTADDIKPEEIPF